MQPVLRRVVRIIQQVVRIIGENKSSPLISVQLSKVYCNIYVDYKY